MPRRSLFALLLVLVPLLVNSWSGSALALNPDAGGWYHTGDSVRTKTVFKVKVYAIGHDMKCLPPTKSKRAIIDADCDKRFLWKMMRDVDKAKIIDALKEAYALNGYTDAAKISQGLAAFSADLKENAQVSITYSAASKTTTFTEQNGTTTTVAGTDFMKGTWSIWFGNIDPPSIGDDLMSKL